MMSSAINGPARWTGLETRRFLPRELCVTVALKEHAREPDNFYEAIRNRINNAVRALPPNFQVENAGDFAADFSADPLRPFFGGTDRLRELLLPLALPAAPGNLLMPSNLVRLRNAAGDTVRALAFYSISAFYSINGDGNPGVLPVVKLLNLSLNTLKLDQGSSAEPWWVLGATPNWLMAGAQNFEDGGGPGSRPEPAPVGNWKFRLGTGDANSGASQNDGSGVIVAILDTCPDRSSVQQARQAHPGNWLLRRVDPDREIDGPLSIDPLYFQLRQTLPHTVARWPQSLPTPPAAHDYKMPDHGLFVAGIIRDIAPGAEIHLIRVLSDYGVGDLCALVSVLGALPGHFLRGPNKNRLVVNLSLMVDVPPGAPVNVLQGQEPLGAEFLELLLPEATAGQSADDINALLGQNQNKGVMGALVGTQISLQGTTAWLSDQEAEEFGRRELLVAAAGNDGRDKVKRPATRLPARFDNVLGVAAVNRLGQPSGFSNRSDEEFMGDGVATFGGDAPYQPSASAVRIDMTASLGEVDAVAGIWSAPNFPMEGATTSASGVAGVPATPPITNATGWAYWAGTSFATSIISGLAARLWGADNTQLPPELIEAIRSFDTRTTANPTGSTVDSTALNCPVITAKQTF